MRKTIPIEPLSPASNPTEHYDTVVNAWADLLGQNLHYGYFESENSDLAEATEALTNQMLSVANLHPGLMTLDVGCGTGRAAWRIAQEFDAHVVGISPSKECVERANALAKSITSHGSASFAIGDGTDIAFEDGCFDRVWIMESSHLMQHKSELLAESVRVLKPQGVIILCDIILKEKLPLEKVIEYRDEFLLLRNTFGRAIMEPLSFYSDALKRLGLQIGEERDISAQTYPTFRHWRENAEENKGEVISELGETGWTEFFKSCEVLEHFWESGILGYGIISACKTTV